MGKRRVQDAQQLQAVANKSQPPPIELGRQAKPKPKPDASLFPGWTVLGWAGIDCYGFLVS